MAIINKTKLRKLAFKAQGAIVRTVVRLPKVIKRKFQANTTHDFGIRLL